MAIGDDFAIDISGNITHVSGSTNYTVLELHRWLQDLADDASAAGNDLIDITSDTPSERSTDNIITLNSPFNIDDTAAKYLYDGSILQDDGDTLYSGLVVVGSVYGTTTLQVIQDQALYDGDTPFWLTGINVDAANNILTRMLIKTRVNGADIDKKKILLYAREWGESFAEFSITLGLGNSTAAIFTVQDLNNATASATVATWTTITNTEGWQEIDLNNGSGDQPYYSQWNRDIYTINQLYERAKYNVRRATAETIHTMDGELFRGITHQFDYDGLAGGPFTEDEVIAWGTQIDYDNESTPEFSDGEYVTIGSNGAAGKILVIDDQGATGTLTIALEDTTITINDGDLITGLTSGTTADVDTTITNNDKSGGLGRLLALDTTLDRIWIQLLMGDPPVDDLPLEGKTSGATAAVDGSITSRTLSPVYLGQSTGTAIIGGYGIGIEPADLTSSDKLFDLTNTQQQPPNNVTFTVLGLVSGEDRVLVTEDDGGAINTDQMTLDVALTGATETAIDVGTIPVDTPQTGNLRVVLEDGRHRYVDYLSWTGSVFTIASSNWTDPNDAQIGAHVYVGYIDKLAAATSESDTYVYNEDRTLFVRVRDGGSTPIKTFETTGVMGIAGGSVTAIRTPDA